MHHHFMATIDDEHSAVAESLEYDKIKDPDFLRRNKHWIVLVDDEEDIRMAVGDYLYDQGYQVTACADVDALFEACQVGQPDIAQTTTKNTDHPGTATETKTLTLPDAVISDIRMPGKDGMQLLTLLRTTDSRWERVPVILLTAKAMTQDRIAGYKAGADYFLPKPFNPEELLSMIDNAILRRQQMAGTNGRLLDLKDDLANVKVMLRQNGSNVVKKTNVFLTPAERQVLELLCQGCTNGEIATKRGVSVIGVNRMIQKLYSSTQTRTRTELVRWAITTGYVSAR
jgi:DNA-binding NarL/FixJ family response regulator